MSTDSWLLALARQAVESAVNGEPAPEPGGQIPMAASDPGACFVTLTREGQLRGCIGSLTASGPLWKDVRDNARAAALHDPRFAPLTPAELPGIAISLSILDAPEPLRAGHREDLLAQLRPGVDGLTISAGQRRATFLPSVWEQLPEPGQFLDRLKQKAGLPEDFPETALQCERYTVTHLTEDAPPVRRMNQ